MSRRAASWLAPLYLASCLLIGGSAQGVTYNFVLQLAGAAIIALAIAVPERDLPGKPGLLRPLAAALVAWAVLQLVPLPSTWWPQLPGREVVAQGFEALGMSLPAIPISLDPNESLAALLSLVPPAAMFVLVRRSDESRRTWLAVTIVVAALAAIGLGALQVGSGGSFYLYPFVNRGVATGFFANANHFGALLLVTTPFLAELVRRWVARTSSGADRWVAVAGSAGLAATLALGIVLNHSLAVLLLGVPVWAASALLLIPRDRLRLRRRWAALAVAVGIAGCALAVTVAARADPADQTSLRERLAMWDVTADAIATYGLAGTGLGTFPAVYAMHEDPAQVDRTIVNHAHNDYLEWALELGLPGALLILLLLGWWAVRAAAPWSQRAPAAYARAASIASAALLAHSIVDYPLRTAALAAVMGLCLALLTLPQSARQSPSSLGRRPRHLDIAQLA